MVAEHKSPEELTYEEQVAIARANLERHLEEARRRREVWQAEHGDPEEALNTLVRELFPDPELFAEVWREWRIETGHTLAEDW